MPIDDGTMSNVGARMKIVHLSDLHFGKHDEELANNLLDRLAELRPNMIICTGDLANTPTEEEFRKASKYLESIQKACAGNDPTASPELLIVPGNHDVRTLGFVQKVRRRGLEVLTGETPDYYSEDDNVWVFGFDSASGGKLGGSGYINNKDITRFHERYESLKRLHGPAFTKSTVKIVAVHHHPLPVTPSHDGRSRWLIMTNSGRFLAAVLSREVDLVLHGHEHVQAQARLWSSIGAGDRGVCIVSLGATLRKGGDEQNWFGVVDASPSEVGVRFYKSKGDQFLEKSEGKPFYVRSKSQSEKLAFDHAEETHGYSYVALASICVIDKDGDATRTVECDRLIIKRSDCKRASRHPIKLPPASGYVSALRASTLSDWPVTLEQSVNPELREHEFKTSLKFGPLAAGDEISYRYEWRAVNSFALNEREFGYMYQAGETEDDNVEFSHYVVADPAKTLTVIVQFPEEFVAHPRLRVTEYEEQKSPGLWKPRPDIEQALRAQYALRYFETLRTVALRVLYPQQGMSYGIEWTVPPIPEATGDDRSVMCEQMRQVLSSGSLSSEGEAALQDWLVGSIEAARKWMLVRKEDPPWPGLLEATFMVFDGKQLRCVAAVVDDKGGPRHVDLDFCLSFGDGIAGRAFKANEFRFYAAQGGRDDEPDYYTRIDDGLKHDVIVAFPIYAPSPPDNRSAPYGVLSIGSDDLTCPLRLASADPERRKEASRLHSDLNSVLFHSLKKVLLDRATRRLDA